MRVLGFDPGTATTGYGVVEGRGTRLHYIAHGTIATPAGMHFAERLLRIHQEAQALLTRFAPTAVAIEKLFFKQNVTNGITVAQARGVLALAAVQAGLPISEFAPTQCKTAITGYGKADKRQMQDMIRILLKLEERPRPDDAADALGLAICRIHLGAVHVDASAQGTASCDGAQPGDPAAALQAAHKAARGQAIKRRLGIG